MSSIFDTGLIKSYTYPSIGGVSLDFTKSRSHLVIIFLFHRWGRTNKENHDEYTRPLTCTVVSALLRRFMVLENSCVRIRFSFISSFSYVVKINKSSVSFPLQHSSHTSITMEVFCFLDTRRKFSWEYLMLIFQSLSHAKRDTNRDQTSANAYG